MTSQTQRPVTAIQRTPNMAWIWRQALLVPEAPLLALSLVWHLLSGPSPVTGSIGLLIAIWFGLRMSVFAAVRRALDHADYRQTERLLACLYWLHPYSADTLALRGVLALARGRTDDAEGALRQALQFYPGQAQLHALLSGTLIENECFAEARREARRALDYDRTCGAAMLQLANAEQLLGAPSSVVEAHLRAGLALRCAPTDAAALRCALAQLLLAQRQAAEAQLVLVGVEALLPRCGVPQRASLHYCLGDLRRSLGDTETARIHFKASEMLDPNGRYAAAAWRAARE